VPATHQSAALQIDLRQDLCNLFYNNILRWEKSAMLRTLRQVLRPVHLGIGAGTVLGAMVAVTANPAKAHSAPAPGSPVGVPMTVGAYTGAATDGGEALRRSLLESATLYVDRNSTARTQVEEWRRTRPTDAQVLDREVASQPTGIWFGDWNRSVRADVDRVMTDAARGGALPVLVAYNIPARDCGSHSAGGASNGRAYQGWISEFARGLAGRRAIVVLEPDALASTDCLSPAQRHERFSLMKQATEALTAQGALVYIDAGHANWLSPAETAARLIQAGIRSAAGFSLNVSNFIANEANIRYGDDVSRRTGGAHYVIDTSRNGAGPTADLQWCNPGGRALGTRPTTRTTHPRLDAMLWIKKPGESDGVCNGGPGAGQWWADYALGLARRSTPVMAMADARR
jgi:endoglucanase